MIDAMNLALIRDLGVRGWSKAEIAVRLGLTYAQLRYRARKDPALAQALEDAHDFALAYWESLARKALTTPIPKQGKQYNKRTRRKHRRKRRLHECLLIAILERRFPKEYGRQLASAELPPASPPTRTIVRAPPRLA
jgi:hypothetical protein